MLLARIFHTDCDEESAKADGVRRVMKSNDGCMFHIDSLAPARLALTGYP